MRPKEVGRLDIVSARYKRAEENGLCPVCGAAMTQVDKLEEGEHIFIWLKCSKSDCNGQWLQKKSRFGDKRVLEK